jgi:hypothetical protein
MRGCNLAHADLQCGVTGREHWAPERIDEVDHSECKGNACTKNHENFCGQDALLFCGIADPFQLCNDLSTCFRRRRVRLSVMNTYGVAIERAISQVSAVG